MWLWKLCVATNWNIESNFFCIILHALGWMVRLIFIEIISLSAIIPATNFQDFLMTKVLYVCHPWKWSSHFCPMRFGVQMFQLMPTPQGSFYVLNDIFRLNYAWGWQCKPNANRGSTELGLPLIFVSQSKKKNKIAAIPEVWI